MTKENNSIGSCIIVGGGPAGTNVARSIVKAAGGSVEIAIVDRQNYLDWSLASPRMLVQPDDVDKYGYVMPLDKVCEHIAGRHGKIQFRQGAVSHIGAKSVVLRDGTTLTADCVVIAIGGHYKSGGIWKPTPDQTTKESRIAAMRVLKEKLAKAHHILITGAGPTGVEVAGEIKSEFPNCTVTIVGKMLPNSTEAARARMKAALEGMGVICMEGRVDVDAPDSDGNVKTRDGETIAKVDLILNAAGFAFAGAELADDTIKVDLTPQGQFNCQRTLQLEHCETVFVCGDILAVPEGCFADVKGMKHADDTAQVVGKNLALLLQQKKLVEFKWSKTAITKPMMTALGPAVGVGFVGLPAFMEDWMCRTFKCKDYYMSMKAKLYGKGKTW